MWVTLLLQTLLKLRQEYKDKGMKWPKVLYLQADNASDNKNLSMYAVCQLLRDLGIFKKVKLSYLPVGHTHEDIDACFGALARQLVSHDVYTMADVERLWKRGWGGNLYGFKEFILVTVRFIFFV